MERQHGFYPEILDPKIANDFLDNSGIFIGEYVFFKEGSANCIPPPPPYQEKKGLEAFTHTTLQSLAWKKTAHTVTEAKIS